jgi:hypothetical protein
MTLWIPEIEGYKIVYNVFLNAQCVYSTEDLDDANDMADKLFKFQAMTSTLDAIDLRDIVKVTFAYFKVV